ncbi:hypothetical protein MTR_1g110950 [Medicago truncatula]|uniref:Uncharacterized protein n=1 Tax=Medicago truncatula TaxID=3880 RepID=A0A072VS00_MEDTR|nr:hypothetical protein MTR_1g110950 [Medicago truncatula]
MSESVAKKNDIQAIIAVQVSNCRDGNWTKVLWAPAKISAVGWVKPRFHGSGLGCGLLPANLNEYEHGFEAKVGQCLVQLRI